MSSAAVEPPPSSWPFAHDAPARLRAALVPEEAAGFDEQWRAAMGRATESLDLTEVLAVLEAWRRIARMITVNGPQVHRSMYRRAAARLGHDVPDDEPLARTKERLGL